MSSGKSDELKGRVKEAAGALTGDAKLKRTGEDRPGCRKDQAEGGESHRQGFKDATSWVAVPVGQGGAMLLLLRVHLRSELQSLRVPTRDGARS